MTRSAAIERRSPMKFKFNLEQLADFICEFTRDGKRTKDRDVVQWYRWLERKCGVLRPQSPLHSNAPVNRRSHYHPVFAPVGYAAYPLRRFLLPWTWGDGWGVYYLRVRGDYGRLVATFKGKFAHRRAFGRAAMLEKKRRKS